jgi:hypothetical protein
VQQHLDSPTFSHVLTLLLRKASSAKRWPGCGDIPELLQEQRAVAQHLEGGALVQVLHAAVACCANHQGSAWPILKTLIELPNVQQLGGAVVLELLIAAVGTGNRMCVYNPYGWKPDIICSLPAAQHLSVDDVVRLLLAAVEAFDTMMLCALLDLPGAQQLSDGDVIRVLRAAENGAGDDMWQLCSLLLCC